MQIAKPLSLYFILVFILISNTILFTETLEPFYLRFYGVKKNPKTLKTKKEKKYHQKNPTQQ